MRGPRFARLGSFVVAVVLCRRRWLRAERHRRAGHRHDRRRAARRDGRGAQPCADRADADGGVGRATAGTGSRSSGPAPTASRLRSRASVTFVREGIVLESEFTATINAQMKVGALEETVTVSGASPVVDVQSTMSRTVLSKEQMEALPSGRSYQSLAATIPALGSAPRRAVRRRRLDADVAGDRRGVWLASGRHGARDRRHERRQHPQHRTDFRHLPQPERLRGDVVPGGRGLRRVADRRRPDQHDPEAGRQPIHLGRRRHLLEREPAEREQRRRAAGRRGSSVPPNLYDLQGLQLLDRRADQAGQACGSSSRRACGARATTS